VGSGFFEHAAGYRRVIDRRLLHCYDRSEQSTGEAEVPGAEGPVGL